MKIVLSWHVLNKKIPLLKSLNWDISKAKIRQTINKPKWKGVTEEGQLTAMSLVDRGYILRVVYKRSLRAYTLKKDDGIISVITIHIARRGRYESTKEN